MFEIELRDVRFHSRIGVFEQERIVSNEFLLNLSVSYPDKDFVNEDIDTSISYADLYVIVSEVMKREWLLLESACRAIAIAIRQSYAGVDKVRVSIEKLSVPIPSFQGTARVTLTL